jgi:hypothetical protein
MLSLLCRLDLQRGIQPTDAIDPLLYLSSLFILHRTVFSADYLKKLAARARVSLDCT